MFRQSLFAFIYTCCGFLHMPFRFSLLQWPFASNEHVTCRLNCSFLCVFMCFAFVPFRLAYFRLQCWHFCVLFFELHSSWPSISGLPIASLLLFPLRLALIDNIWELNSLQVLVQYSTVLVDNIGASKKNKHRITRLAATSSRLPRASNKLQDGHSLHPAIPGLDRKRDVFTTNRNVKIHLRGSDEVIAS